MGISASAAVLIALLSIALTTPPPKKASKAAESLFAEDSDLRTRSQHYRNARKSDNPSTSDAAQNTSTSAIKDRDGQSKHEGTPVVLSPSNPCHNRTGKKPRHPAYFGWHNLTESEREYWTRRQRWGKDRGPSPKLVTVSPDYLTAEMRCNGVVIRDFAYQVRC
ncbi:hypothetical protein MBLNU457_4682t2 [Dothideomycetes sp. NU457]